MSQISRRPLFIILICLSLSACTQINQSSSLNENYDNKSEVSTKDKIPAEKMTTQSKLDLSNQNLKTVPENTFSKTKIEELDISNNNLTGAVQAEIRHLQNLKILNMSNNQLTGVPAEVGQLKNLEVLDLSNNQITGLPYELGNLKNLKILNLAGNDYAQQDLEIIKKGLPQDVNIITE